jgi:nitroimidazol reductase NimA-like FMN-containing flavoprotein (pyridoxamine 5'-phosphate oxidase superfamily)
MRRKDREVKDLTEIIQIIDRCDVCHMGLEENGRPYVIPLSFGFSVRDGGVTFYFHCACEGRKIDILKQNPKVCLQFDCGHRLITGDKACNCSTEYESVIAFGTAELITGREGKVAALTHLMKHYETGETFDFDSRMIEAVAVIKVTAERISGKRKKQRE